jgi:hypothetical protein
MDGKEKASEEGSRPRRQEVPPHLQDEDTHEHVPQGIRQMKAPRIPTPQQPIDPVTESGQGPEVEKDNVPGSDWSLQDFDG